nr:MAG TPA: hypothetical protein [Caudoviricetes sp.]
MVRVTVLSCEGAAFCYLENRQRVLQYCHHPPLMQEGSQSWQGERSNQAN